MKALQIVTSAYRCNVEEQDDPVLWIAEAMRRAGGDVHVLLEGTAVNYSVRGQDASGLSFGGKPQTQPARIEADLRRLVDEGANVYVVEDDVAELGVERNELVAGVQGVSRAGLAPLLARYDQVWRW
jgi:hypothetical protein